MTRYKMVERILNLANPKYFGDNPEDGYSQTIPKMVQPNPPRSNQE